MDDISLKLLLNEIFLAGNILLEFQDFLESFAPDPRRSIPGEEEFSQDSRLVTLETSLIFLTVCCSGSPYDLFIRTNVGVVDTGRGSLGLAMQGVYVAIQGGYVAIQDGYVAIQGGYVAIQGGYVTIQGGYLARQGGYVAIQGG
jgi:hypothetical protein